MKVVDIIKTSAELLNLDSAKTALAIVTSQTESTALQNADVTSLLKLIHFSVQEMCTNYLPLIKTETIQTTSKQYPIASLTNFIRVENITDSNQNKSTYKIINRNLVFVADGSYTIQYLTYPTISSLFDDVDFFEKINVDIVVFGLCAYYCLSQGRFDEFKTFNQNYASKAENLKSLKMFSLPTRRWE